MKPSLLLTFTVSTVTLFTIISTSTPARAADPWYEIHRLYPQPAGNNGRFASSTSISGSAVVVGAWADDDLGHDAGAAYIFNAQTGIKLFKLHAPDGSANDHFGQSVAINANLIIIGAPDDDDLGQSSGSAYVFLPLNIVDQLTVSPDPLIAGQNGTFSVRGALPNNATWLIYSLKGLKPGFINQLNTSIDLLNPVLADGPKNTDANGDLDFVLPIPNINNSLIVWLQTVQMRNSTISVATQIIP